jgi:hypothetical protein
MQYTFESDNNDNENFEQSFVEDPSRFCTHYLKLDSIPTLELQNYYKTLLFHAIELVENWKSESPLYLYYPNRWVVSNTVQDGILISYIDQHGFSLPIVIPPVLNHSFYIGWENTSAGSTDPKFELVEELIRLFLLNTKKYFRETLR